MLEISKRKIKCSIFSAKEKIIQELNYDIWRADLTTAEIMAKARELRSEADLLYHCPKSNGDVKCKICRAICTLRKRTADYITGEDKLKIGFFEPVKVVEVKNN